MPDRAASADHRSRHDHVATPMGGSQRDGPFVSAAVVEGANGHDEIRTWGGFKYLGDRGGIEMMAGKEGKMPDWPSQQEGPGISHQSEDESTGVVGVEAS